MKTRKTIIYGLLAVILVLAFAACSGSGGGGGKSLNSATELKEYLDKQPANSPDKPIKVAMKANEMMIGDIAKAINDAGKYVSLDLSGSPLTEIPNSAFNNCKTLAGITIGNGVTGIGASAFSGTGLTGITIPNSVTSIGEYAFSGCTNLTSVTIGSGSIGEFAFNDCTSLTSITIGNGVTSIGANAFNDCTSLTSITIPASVTEINTSFSNLTAITVDANNANYSSEGGILYNKAKTEIIEALRGISGNVTIPNSVTSIGDNAFTFCTSLTSITIPNSVTSIGVHAFWNCTSLTSITIPASVTYVGSLAFSDWTSSQTINIQGKANRAATIAAGWEERTVRFGQTYSSAWDGYCNAQINYGN